MAATILRVSDVAKKFTINRDKSLKERLTGLGRDKRHVREFWALRDVSFELDAGLGNCGLSLTLHVSWLKPQFASQFNRSPGVASCTGPLNTCDASLVAPNGSSSTQRWDNTSTPAPASRASAPASAGVMCPRDSCGSAEVPRSVPSATTIWEPLAAAARFAAGPVSAE